MNPPSLEKSENGVISLILKTIVGELYYYGPKGERYGMASKTADILGYKKSKTRDSGILRRCRPYYDKNYQYDTAIRSHPFSTGKKGGVQFLTFLINHAIFWPSLLMVRIPSSSLSTSPG